MSEENKALGRREIDEIFNGTNLDAADEIYAADFVDHDRAFSWEMHGPEQMKEYVGVFHGAFPDFRVTLEDQIAEENKVVNRWTVRGTHRGEFQGVAPTGKEVEFTGIHISTINEEGKLQESWENYDAFSLMQQLGAIPAPGDSEEASPT